MHRSHAGDTIRGIPAVTSDFECQVGGMTSLVTRSPDMASHPLLPELTGTKDKQCQAFALTSDVQCQVINATTEAQCQVRSGAEYNSQSNSKDNTPQGQKHRKKNTTCSASQCRLPSPSTELADAHSQTDVTGAPVTASSSDVCSQTDPVLTSSNSKAPKQEFEPVADSSNVQSQTDVTSTCEPNMPTLTDNTAVQAVISSLDAMNQTDTASTATQWDAKDVSTMTMGRFGGQTAPNLDHSVMPSV